MYDRNAALSHYFAQVRLAELVGDVPADGLDDEQTVKVAAFEEHWQVRGKLDHAADYLHSSAFAPEPVRERTDIKRSAPIHFGLSQTP